NDHNSWKNVDVERGRVDDAESISHLITGRAGHLLQCGVHHSLFADVQYEQKRCPHHQRANRQQQQHSSNLSQHVFEARYWLCKNSVKYPVVEILWKESRSGNDRQKGCQNRDRAQRNVLQDLKFLLKRELRHEDRAADQKESKDQEHIKNLQPCQFGNGVDCDRVNAREREGSIPLGGC